MKEGGGESNGASIHTIDERVCRRHSIRARFRLLSLQPLDTVYFRLQSTFTSYYQLTYLAHTLITLIS